VAELHGLLARITLVITLATSAWSVAILVAGRPIRPALLAGLGWVVALLAATGALGLLSAVTVRPPSDALHLVYGVLAIAVLPGAWLIGRSGPDPRRRVIVLAIASVILVILSLRLFQTGG